MTTFTITPHVDATQEFIEIANDFANPLDLIREGISNSYDASAQNITITFDVIEPYGERILKIVLEDDGVGMGRDELQSFFDLGNSPKRNDRTKIGEKGHGTKIFFNSKQINVETVNDNVKRIAVLDNPYQKLFSREIPQVNVEEIQRVNFPSGTKIIILGYNNNRCDRFTHDIIKDYILWFTKHGSISLQEGNNIHSVCLKLKGLGSDEHEIIPAKHYFPDESPGMDQLFETHLTKAPHYYCKRVQKRGNLRNFPDISYTAIFSIEGKQVKYNSNPMIRRKGYRSPEGAYTIQERYGLWVCKDGIPIQRKNEWILFKGSEYTKLHAFVNCQSLRLTANRSSIENTPSEVLSDLKIAVQSIYDELANSSDWTNMEWLEEEAESYHTIEKERTQFEWRKRKLNRSKIAKYKNYTLVEPDREIGVYSLFLLVSFLEPELFPFQILDYDTHDGIDVIAKGDRTKPISQSRMFYIEFKKLLSKSFNHSFENLKSIICWDTDLCHEDVVVDLNNEERKFQIITPAANRDYTRFFLENPRKVDKIEVYVLKLFLNEKLGVEFQTRTNNDVA
ncbi:MAG: ATP-binding protein [Candidatus Wallbacteria bacterium]|nr:ATP-binding protein [Candidatus Wallbacteria bacterium]